LNQARHPAQPRPPLGTIEHWCEELILAQDLEQKLAPSAPPDLSTACAWEQQAPARRLSGPSRPGLEVRKKSPKAPSAGALRQPEARARLLHTCLHHELQAAELFAWAILAFPETPREFRVGLLRLCREELAHLALYRTRLQAQGFEVGAFPVRDWFWARLTLCQNALEFVSLMGLGIEAGNLEHGQRLAGWFRDAGDAESALVFEQVEREEIGHVAFGRLWFERFSGAALEFDAWRQALPQPLSPALLRGATLNRAARARAGLSVAFLDALEAFPPIDPRQKRPLLPDSPAGVAGASQGELGHRGLFAASDETAAAQCAEEALPQDSEALESLGNGLSLNGPNSNSTAGLHSAEPRSRAELPGGSEDRHATVKPNSPAVLPSGAAAPNRLKAHSSNRGPVAWVLNLDAEHELEVRGPFTPSQHLRDLVAREQRRVLPGLVEPGDIVLDPSAPDFNARLQRARGLPGRCWSPTPRALQLLKQAGAELPAAPEVEILRCVNARPFAAQLRADLLLGAATDSAMAGGFDKHIASDLETALAHLRQPAALGWLVRRTFGAAGRGRRRIAAGTPDAGELAWLRTSLRLGPLTIEPWVEIEREFTRSAYLTRTGHLTLSGPCFQTTTPQGAWLGTRAADRFERCSPADDQALATTLEAAGRALHQAGYFGPFGIDAYRHRRPDGQGSALNPLTEINARFTMDFAAALRLAPDLP
jgi:uncharacterized ferritin-like protein (DUF455 family)